MKKLISLLFVLPTLIFSQIDATINGYIYDSKSQLPLLGANVIIEGTDNGAISVNIYKRVLSFFNFFTLNNK